MNNKIEFLIIHTEASPIITNAPRFEVVNQFHQQRLFDKSSLGWFVGYHYFIEKSGKLIQARLDDEEGMHTKGYNLSSLSICMAGNGDVELPTKEQIETLKKWINEKAKQYDIPKSKILPHRKFLPLFEKSCYGLLLMDDWAANFLEEKPVVIKATVSTSPIIENLKQQVSLMEKIVGLLKRIIFLKSMNPLKKFGSDGQSYPAVLASSIDSKRLSATIKSLAILIPFALATAKFFGTDLGEGELNDLLELASNTILAVGTAVTTGTSLFYLCRRILVKLNIL